MRIRRNEEDPSEPTGEIFVLEREDDPAVEPPSEREPLGKPLVPFEALPVKTIVSRW